MYQPQPQPRQIQALSQFTVTKVACGQNHTLALTKEGQAFTWGKACMLVQPGAKAPLVWMQHNMSASCHPLRCCFASIKQQDDDLQYFCLNAATCVP